MRKFVKFRAGRFATFSVVALLSATGSACGHRTLDRRAQRDTSVTAVNKDRPSEKKYISVEEAASLPNVRRVGFDVDDTLLFSSPAFAKGFASGHKFGTNEFWTIVNTSDRDRSIVKQAAKTIVEKYQQRGVKIYAITARPPPGGAELKKYLNEVFGIPEENTFFEPSGKTKRLRELQLDVFFGDSDSDITDALAAGVRAIRFQRSPKSSYRNKDGTLRKYHPGMHKEEIVKGSEE